jgi:hypothetical protein
VRGIAEVREWAQHQLVDDVEHRGVRADAQTERHHDGSGESGAAAKAAERVSDVLLEIVEPGDGPPVARIFAYASDVAKLPSRGLPRVSPSHGTRVALEVLAVEPQLVAQLSIQPISATPIEESSEPFAH